VPAVTSDQDNSLIDIIEASTPNGTLFVSHYLFDAYDEIKAHALLVTQLRHPVARIVSVYSWLRKFHAASYGGPEKFPTLEQFAAASRGISHSQIAQLSIGFGVDWRNRIHKTSAAEMRDVALATLERRVAWFGLAEVFEESIFAFAALCGLPAVPPWAGDTRNAERTLVADLPASDRAAIEYYYEAELEFYRMAKQLFLSRIGQLTFGSQLNTYRDACVGQYKERLDAWSEIP
jgi:hypothetical protein